MTDDELYEWRMRLDMSQAEAAAAIGISLRQYGGYERGQRPITLLIENAVRGVVMPAYRARL